MSISADPIGLRHAFLEGDIMLMTLKSKKAGFLNVQEVSIVWPYLKNMIGEMNFSRS